MCGCWQEHSAKGCLADTDRCPHCGGRPRRVLRAVTVSSDASRVALVPDLLDTHLSGVPPGGLNHRASLRCGDAGPQREPPCPHAACGSTRDAAASAGGSRRTRVRASGAAVDGGPWGGVLQARGGRSRPARCARRACGRRWSRTTLMVDAAEAGVAACELGLGIPCTCRGWEQAVREVWVS